ncbi:hypothetical protein AVEN_114762-1 [Araneus ventricosus]|uniref:Uncharacterized protein n=1 Tax=Araneus ventricosus TaxID=182803 RepID=A0A4Y2NDN7_ARAVE|nr:hypothetical protein AVEN_114762-1 [Araneus ventricosus]
MRIQLKLFLQAMTLLSQLTSIRFINMGNYFRHLDCDFNDDLLMAFISFFSSQENLKTVVLQNCRFLPNDGLEILKAIFHCDSNTIINLTLRGFLSKTRIWP